MKKPTPRYGQATRIRRLEIRDFKGWGQRGGDPYELDLDADLVILTGSNGLGKTSLMEALAVLLCGRAMTRSATGEHGTSDRAASEPHHASWSSLVHRPPTEGGEERRGFEIRAEAEITRPSTSGDEGGEDDPRIAHLSFEYPADTNGGSDEGQAAPEPRGLHWDHAGSRAETAEGTSLPVDLYLASTAFFQDEIDFVLDDLGRATTLREWFRPIQSRIEALMDTLEEEADKSEEYAEKTEARLARLQNPDEDYVSALERFVEAWNRSAPDIGMKRVGVEGLLQEGELADLRTEVERHIAQEKGHQAASDIVSPDVEDLPVEARRLLELLRAWRGLDPAAQEKIHLVKNQLEDLYKERDRIRGRSQKAQEVMAWMRGAGGTTGMLEMLESLRSNHERWSAGIAHLPEASSLRRLEKQLDAVDPGTLEALTAQVRSYLEPWEALIERRRKLENKIQEREAEKSRLEAQSPLEIELYAALEEVLRHAGVEQQRREQLADPSNTEKQVQDQRRIAAALRHVRAHIERKGMEPISDSDSVREQWEEARRSLEKIMNDTLVRFSFPRELLPMKIEALSGSGDRQGGMIEGNTGLTWPHLSTGQRAQLAMAYVAAQANVLRDALPHRVLLLDDTSTAFDLGSLQRQGSWLRQLAFNPKRNHRWQVFISSHHEEMTSRLVQTLLPPPGRTVKLVEFKDWKAGEGPEFRIYDVVAGDTGDPNNANQDWKRVTRKLAEALEFTWPEL